MSSSAARRPSIDPIDEYCLASVFDEASKYLSNNRKLKVSQELKLKFYGLFKQATEGPCTRPKPSLLEFVERAKWSAWHELGNMTKDEAVAQYVKELDQLAPAWRQEMEAKALEGGDDDDSEDEKGSGGGISAGQSKFQYEGAEEEKPDLESIVYWAAQNKEDKIRELLRAGGRSINDRDGEGRTALHIAADRGFEALLKRLLNNEFGADPNVQDKEGSTPLHFAVMVEEQNIVRALMEHGADPNIADANGESPLDMAEGEIKQILTNSKGKKSA